MIVETKLNQTKQTMGKAIGKLKKLRKLENILKRRNVVLTTSEDEEPEDQGRIFKDIDDDPLVASQRSKLVDKGKCTRGEKVQGKRNLKPLYEEGRTAKKVHLDALLAKRLAEEEELNEQQKQRKAQVQFEAQHYTEEDWDAI
ncbi:hypothetical protein Tco_0004849 [Tanacetum coccineum]